MATTELEEVQAVLLTTADRLARRRKANHDCAYLAMERPLDGAGRIAIRAFVEFVKAPAQTKYATTSSPDDATTRLWEWYDTGEPPANPEDETKESEEYLRWMHKRQREVAKLLRECAAQLKEEDLTWADHEGQTA